MDRAEVRPPYRKLVSVRRVSRIKKLDSSHTHEVVMVDGWPVVVEKGQFAANQKVLYFAIDCFLPSWDKRYESYRFSQFLVELHGERGWAVQTVKFEGHISQGMVFALSDAFPEIVDVRKELEELWEMQYVEQALMRLDLKGDFKIKKWSTFCEYILPNADEVRCRGLRVPQIHQTAASISDVLPASSLRPNQSESRTFLNCGRLMAILSFRSRRFSTACR